MTIIDCQVHAYERNHPGRPWAGTLPGPAEVTGDDMIAAMDAAGVDAAILVSVFSMYRFDPSYALSVWAKHPTRLALVKPVDPADPAVAETIAQWADTDGAVAARVLLTPESTDDPADAGLNRVLTAAGQHDLPINFSCPPRLRLVRELARRHPNTQVVIDHLGMHPTHDANGRPINPFGSLPEVLKFAECDNVAIKVSATCLLSAQPYPFADIWDPLARVFDAFGFERCMWGTDWTRVLSATYREAVDAFRLNDKLSTSDRAKLMGETLSKIYQWTPQKA